MNRLLPLAAILVVILTGCNGGSEGNGASSADVTGSWAWRRMYLDLPEENWHNGIWQLIQAGTQITGVYQALCHTTAAEYQNITGTIVDGTITISNGRVTFTGTVNGMTMTGTWQYGAGMGPGGTHPWDAAKQ